MDNLFGDIELPSLPWKDAVRLVRKVAPKRSTFALIQYAKATCDGAYCTFLATDLDIGVQVRTPCTHAPGVYVMDIGRMVAGLPFDKCISDLDHNDYPNLPMVPEKAIYLDPHWVPAMCDVSFACSEDSTRLSLNGVAVQADGVTATDGHRASHRAIGTGALDEFIVPRPAVALVAGIKHPVQRVVVEHKVITSFVWFSYPWGTVVSKLMEGPYPNWRQLVVRRFMWELSFPREKWVEWLKQCPNLKSPDPKRPLFSQIRAVREDGRLKVSFYHGTVGEVDIEEMDSEGPDVKIAWNPAYLLESIAHVSGPVVTVAGNMPTQATFLQPGDGNVDILMPLRIPDA